MLNGGAGSHAGQASLDTASENRLEYNYYRVSLNRSFPYMNPEFLPTPFYIFSSLERPFGEVLKQKTRKEYFNPSR